MSARLGKFLLISSVFGLLGSVLAAICLGQYCPGGACPAPVWQQQAPAPAPRVELTANVRRAIVRIGYQLGSETSYGTATAVQRANGRVYLVTCWHLFRDGRGGRSFLVIGQQRWPAILLAIDKTNETSLLAADDPGPEALETVELSEYPPTRGEMLFVAGFGSGQFAASSGVLSNYVHTSGQEYADTMEISTTVRQGDSGGPILNSRGQLVGVLWGSDHQYSTCGIVCSRVWRVVRAILPPYRRRPIRMGPLVPVQPPTGQFAPPSAPIVQIPPPAVGDAQPSPVAPPAVDPALAEQLARQAARIDALEKQVALVQVTAGPPGKDGAQGPPGPAGPPGQGPSVEQVAAALAKMPITFRKVDANGAPIGETKVYLGGTVDFKRTDTPVRVVQE